VPSSFLGLALYTAFLLPGYVSFVRRRSLTTAPKLSPLLETISLLSVSVITNGLALALFALLRAIVPSHTPDVGLFLRDGSPYAEERIGYLLAWCALILGTSCAIAFFSPKVSQLAPIRRALNPIIVDISAWYHVFEENPPSPDEGDSYPYVACTLEDGSYVAGRLSWYSTEVEETADRDLAVTDPLTILDPDGNDVGPSNSIVVISARQIRWFSVTWVFEETVDGAEPVT
jgi:hypothetical protein